MIKSGRWGDAANHQGEADDTLRDIDSRIGTTRTYLEAIDMDKLDESAQIEFDAVGDELAVGQDELTPMLEFYDGM